VRFTPSLAAPPYLLVNVSISLTTSLFTHHFISCSLVSLLHFPSPCLYGRESLLSPATLFSFRLTLLLLAQSRRRISPVIESQVFGPCAPLLLPESRPSFLEALDVDQGFLQVCSCFRRRHSINRPPVIFFLKRLFSSPTLEPFLQKRFSLLALSLGKIIGFSFFFFLGLALFYIQPTGTCSRSSRETPLEVYPGTN